MSNQHMSGLERVAGVVGLIAAVTTAVAWFLGDVSRIARVALAALALAALILFLVPPKRRFRLLASAPLVLVAVLVVLPGTRSWLLEQGEESRDGPKGPPVVIEDVRPAWDSPNSGPAQRFRVSIVIRNRASEPVVINRALLGYHQGGGAVGGASSDIWLQDQVLAVHETDTGQILEIRQSDSPNDQFAVRASAFQTYFGDVWDQILVLRPQTTIAARSLHTLRVTVPLTLQLSVIRNNEGEDITVTTQPGKQADFFVRFSQGQYDDFPRLLTVTVNTTGGDCARRTTVLERGKNPSARPRTSAVLRWTPLSSGRVDLVLVWLVMVGWLGPGGRRDGNDNWSL
jgi:hypothetical protein